MSELIHYGVLGMKWGVRHDYPPGSGHYPDGNVSDKSSKAKSHEYHGETLKEKINTFHTHDKFSLTDSQKKAIKIGVAVAGTALAAYGLYKVGLFDSLLNKNVPLTKNAFGEIYKRAFGEKVSGLASFKTAKLAHTSNISENMHQPDLWKSLSSEQQSGIESYTTSKYRVMNKILRGTFNEKEDLGYIGDPDYRRAWIDSLKEDAKHCSEVLDKASLPKATMGFRGTRIKGDSNGIIKLLGLPAGLAGQLDLSDKSVIDSLKGMKFIDKGIGSFGGHIDDAWNGVKLHTYMPKGSKALYVAPYSHHPSEHEFMVKPGAEYLIKDIIVQNGVITDLFVELTTK